MKPRSPRTKSIWIGLEVALVIVGTVLLVVLLTGRLGTSKAEIGEPIPDIQMKMQTLDGRFVSLSEFGGSPLIVNFWASWCRPCVREFPVFAQALRARRDLKMLGVVYDDSKKPARAFSERFGGTWPSVFDSDGDLAAIFGVATPPGIPQTFFIDDNNLLRSRVFGEMTADRLEAELASLLGSSKVRDS